VAFGGPDGFFLGFAFAHAAGDVGSCFSSGFELGSDDQVDHLVGLSVAAPVEPVSLLTARRGVIWCNPGPSGHSSFGGEPTSAGELGEELGGGDDTSSGNGVDYPSSSFGHQLIELS